MSKLDEAAEDHIIKVPKSPCLECEGVDESEISNIFKAGAAYERKRSEILLEALVKIANEASGLLYAHEHALAMDGGNSNAQCLSLRVDEARLTIQKYKESEGG